jgi:hypothetical protein
VIEEEKDVNIDECGGGRPPFIRENSNWILEINLQYTQTELTECFGLNSV